MVHLLKSSISTHTYLYTNGSVERMWTFKEIHFNAIIFFHFLFMVSPGPIFSHLNAFNVEDGFPYFSLCSSNSI